MPNQSDVRWFVITTLASWNLVSGFGFYAYILDCFFNYPPEHEKRQFKYHTFSGRINQDIVIGITMTKRKCFIYGIFISMAFPCACLPVWPLAVAHVSIALAALSYYFG
ncbi:uncharacterized protein LOC128255813 isoform X2 [Drosophila gunungcola]|uniref:uncharacterized protein LOC128255813 isoform X2 n=1 Tax=Drosophila gunungcola TaxID=103775 RepID=UPI0022E09005|nr:uncharacterized protein LOC128255813 isoform X2 [Drosophila gunungcola]